MEIGGSRVYRVNPNPNFRVPEMSGIDFLEQISDSIFENSNFIKPEIPNPNFSVNPNAHQYSSPGLLPDYVTRLVAGDLPIVTGA